MPLGEQPAEGTVPEESVPAEQPEGVVEIGDEKVPLAGVPQTGDMVAVWMAMSALSVAGLFLTGKKRRDEE